MSYSKIDPTSHDTVTSALDVLRAPDTITSIIDSNGRDVYPIGEVNGPQLEFDFRTGNFNYWNPEKTALLLEAKVVKADGSPIEDVDNVNVTPTTNLLHSLFQSITLFMNGANVSHEANYPYVAYIETLVSRSGGFKRSIAATSGWIEDDAGRVDRDDIVQRMNGDIKKRKARIAGSKTFQLCDRLHIPYLNQERYGLPNTDIRIRLTRSSDNFCLLSTDAADPNSYKIVITSAVLIINEVVVNPSIINAHSTLMSAGSLAKYPLTEVETLMFSISANKLSERINIRTNQQAVNRATFILLNHEGRNGSTARDPFKFEHYDVRRISLTVDGRPVPHKPLETNFPADLYTQAYFNLAMATGKIYGDIDHGITMDNFKNGYTMFMFDLTPDGCGGGAAHLIKYGSLTLDVTFGTALPNTVSLLAYLERDELIQFDHARALTKLSTM